MTNPERLEFRRSRLKYLGLALLGAMFVGIGWYMIASGENVLIRAVGWVTVAFFGLGVVAFVNQLVKGGVAFTFDRSGITADNPQIGFIPWEEVESCGIVTVRRQRFFSITFRDPERFLARTSAANRKLAAYNVRKGWGHWAFPFAGLEPGLDQALVFVREHVPGVAVEP